MVAELKYEGDEEILSSGNGLMVVMVMVRDSSIIGC